MGDPSAKAVKGRTVPKCDRARARMRTRWAPDAGWRDLFARSRPEDVLAALVDGDPLGLRRLAGDRVRAAALFLDVDRVHLDALARVAIDAAGEAEELDRAWILARIEASIDRVRGSTAGEAARKRGEDDVAGDDGVDAFEVLARPLELPARALRTACAAFNDLEFPDRIAFVVLVLEGRGFEEAARACSSSVPEMLRRARRALDVLLDPFANPLTAR